MFVSSSPSLVSLSRKPAQAGFTLLEVLVALTIMVFVAGVGILAFGTIQDDSNQRLVQAEMANVASAIREFKSDTGFWPKDGVFSNANTNDANLTNPANLAQLMFAPRNSAGNAILPYDQASGTGWNGPYLSELNARSVTIGNGLSGAGVGAPTSGAVVTVSAIGDPFARAPDGAFFEWRVDSAGGATSKTAILGRPYFYFNNPAVTASIPDCSVPCIVSLGANGRYEPGAATGDDIIVNIAGN